MQKWAYTKGLHDLGNGCWAYLAPDGSWGWSNAGLIVDGEATLLIDTLFDLPLTGEMLGTMRAAVPAARAIDTLVNTHSNGDHTYGNQLVDGARIVASRTCREEMDRRQEFAVGKLSGDEPDHVIFPDQISHTLDRWAVELRHDADVVILGG